MGRYKRMLQRMGSSEAGNTLAMYAHHACQVHEKQQGAHCCYCLIRRRHCYCYCLNSAKFIRALHTYQSLLGPK